MRWSKRIRKHKYTARNYTTSILTRVFVKQLFGYQPLKNKNYVSGTESNGRTEKRNAR